MNRNNIYTVNPLYNGSTTQTTEDGSVQSGGTTIIYQQGGGTGLTDAQKQKLDGIQEGAEVNQNAYSKVRLNGSDTLIIEAKNKTDILNMSGVYPIAIAINGNGGLDFTVSSDQSNTNSVVTQSQLKAAIDQLEKDKYWKVDADGKLYTELDVYSHKEISAYGAGTGGGSTGGAGALYECADVLRDGDKVKGAEVGSVLSYNGTHWYAIPQSAIVPDLSGYATKSYVSQEINDLIGGAPGTLDTLKEIAEALGNNPNFATTVTEMINNIGLRVDDIESRVVSLEDMFEWDKSASASDSSLWRIKAKRDLFGVGEISAYGYSAGTVPTGAQYLYELKDVQLTDLATGQLLQYNGSKWVNIDKNAVGLNETELAKYLTNNNYAKKSDITWANLLNKPTTWGWANITGKPTTLAGYGITDGVPNTRRVSAGSGLAGGGVLSSDVTISLGTIGTAGTYTKVTTDMYGRVVSGTTLSEGDIPTLQISKISGLQSALNSKLNISDFNTWFTIKKDSQGRIVSIQANYDFFSVGEISAYGLGETQPSVTTLAGLNDVTITSPANGQTLIYDSATSQWKNGTIIGGGNTGAISLNGQRYDSVDGVITLPNLATPGDITTALNGYATQAWVTDKNYATQSWVNGKGYVTATALATMGFATQAWVNSQGFLKSNALDNYVTLNTIQNITAAKTFQAGIVSTAFRKSDGTSSQFLKADGSVDSNVYLTQASTDTRYVLKTGDTMTGNLNVPFISTAVNPDNQGDYFYSSDDNFIRRSTWHAALSHLSNKQRTLDLTSLDQNKWYPCIIGAPAYGGTPLRITLFNGLRGNKPTWGSHQQGFSLLLDYEVTGSGWGTIPIAAKLNWYAGSYGGETAFGGRQQDTMASTEIIYLRGGGIYYYRTTNGQELTVQPNGYTWSSSSYNYSAPVKTSQDNSPIEKTFDQVCWAPNNLRNTRTIWGQSFNGTQNVSGALSGATTITATGDITTSANIRGRSIYASADLTAAGYTYCNGRLYVDRGRYDATAYPAISLAIGDSDTGLHWQADGIIEFRSNAKQVGYWGYTDGRLYNTCFKEPTGNGYAATSMMVNGNGSNLYPGIGFHQPGVTAGVVYFTNSGEFKFRNITDTGYTNVYGGNLIADAGFLYSRYNGIEIKIGAENGSYVHFITNPPRSLYFANSLFISGGVLPYTTTTYDLGDASHIWRNIYANKLLGGANWADYLSANYIGGQQLNPQTYFGSGTGLKVAMTAVYTNGAYWSDTLWVNGYYGDDVPKCTALHFPRDGSAEMFISSQETKSTNYGAVYRIWSSKNSNKSDAAWSCSTLNANGRISTTSDIYSAGWIRAGGTNGFYCESYGGGWHMTDSTWIRAYNNKQIYTASTSPDAFHTLGGVNASGRIYAGSYIETHGGLVCAGVGNSGGASSFNVYASFYGNGQHGGIEIGASDNVLGIGVHSNDSWYIWWTNSGSIGSSSNKSYIFSYNGSSWNFTGSVVASGEVTAYSDARLKNNIRTLDYRGRLIPRHYVKDGKQSIGFIAQEVQTLYPELVLGYDKSRPYLSLNYNGCTAVLSAQLNHVEDEVTMLKNKVRELEIKVSVLTEQLHSQAI